MTTIQRPKLTLKRERIAAPAPGTDAELSPDNFWILWNPANRRPTRRHPTLAAALAERDRLRAILPGAEFRVYECRKVAP